MRCPECDAGLPEGAVLCVSCGYHLEKGKHLKTRHGEQGTGTAWDADLDWNPRFGLVTVGIGTGRPGCYRRRCWRASDGGQSGCGSSG